MFNSDNLKGYSFGELNYLEYEINSCFTSLKESLMYHEDLIKSKRDKLRHLIANDSVFNSLNGEKESQYHSQFFDSEESAINTMKYLQRNACLISLFTILESKLKRLCQLIKTELNLGKELNKNSPGNNDIERIRNYLIKQVGLTLDKSNSILLQIENDKILRNAIVHYDGIIEGSKRHCFIIPTSVLVIDWEAKIESPEYLILLIDKIQNFLNELFIEVDLRIPKPATEGN